MDNDPLVIKGFKSIAALSLTQSPCFMAFAGANGAGKSNITDALAFFGSVIKMGATQAIREFGGFEQIHCYKSKKDQRATLCFRITIDLQKKQYDYTLYIHQADNKPFLTESLIVDDDCVIERPEGNNVNIRLKDDAPLTALPSYASDMSALMLLGDHSPLYQFLTNIAVFRIDPLAAKKSVSAKTDNAFLDPDGSNIASVLSSLESDSAFLDQVLDWMGLIVPGMEDIATEKQKLDGSIALTFKEEGTRARFPAHLISDGTIYALCIMTAILSRMNTPGMTIIEEPERGVHPKAIGELVQLMRENASGQHPVFITTHSESIVRNLEPEELWFVSKREGKTQLKHASEAGIDKSKIPLDTAWLTNLFDGGLPW